MRNQTQFYTTSWIVYIFLIDEAYTLNCNLAAERTKHSVTRIAHTIIRSLTVHSHGTYYKIKSTYVVRVMNVV